MSEMKRNSNASAVKSGRANVKTKKKKVKVKFTKKEKIKLVASICMITLSFLSVAVTLLLNWRPFSAGVDLDDDDTGTGAIIGRDEKKDDITYFLCVGFDETESLTDVLMVVAFFKEEKTMKIISIPRDTYIGPEIITGKINAVYGHATSPYPQKKDIRNLVSYINTNIGLPIDYYITINLKGFRKVVDAVGGIPIYIPNDMYDPAGSWMVFKKGQYTLNGQQAEYFVRFRHGYANGDLGRESAQKLFLAAFMKKMQTLSKSKVLSLVTGEMMKYVKTDLTVSEMIYYAEMVYGMDLSDVKTFVVPGTPFTSKYKENYGLSCYAIDKTALIDLLNTEFVSEGNEIDPTIVNPFEVSGVKFSSNSSSGKTFEEYLSGSGKSSKATSKSSDSTSKSSK